VRSIVPFTVPHVCCPFAVYRFVPAYTFVWFTCILFPFTFDYLLLTRVTFYCVRLRATVTPRFFLLPLRVVRCRFFSAFVTFSLFCFGCTFSFTRYVTFIRFRWCPFTVCRCDWTLHSLLRLLFVPFRLFDLRIRFILITCLLISLLRWIHPVCVTVCCPRCCLRWFAHVDYSRSTFVDLILRFCVVGLRV